MRRRALLRSLAALSPLSAGCLAAPDRSGSAGTTADPDRNRTRTTATPETRSPTPPVSDGFAWDAAGEDPFDRFAVGDRDTVAFPEANLSHTVQVLNDDEERRTLRLRVSAAGDDRLARAVTVPEHRRVVVVLAVPRSYRVTAAAKGTDGATIRVPREAFDCRDSTTRVAVRGDGRVEWSTSTVRGRCRPPAVVSRSFTDAAPFCTDDTDDARVSFESQYVAVTGRFHVDDPCHVPWLHSATYDPDADILRVVVSRTVRQSATSQSTTTQTAATRTVQSSSASPAEATQTAESTRTTKTATETPQGTETAQTPQGTETTRSVTTRQPDTETERATETAGTTPTSTTETATTSSEQTELTDQRATSDCADCAGAVPYRAEIRFDRGYPARVVVVHERGRDSTAVAHVQHVRR
ncbi:MAG: hypothetical protein ABEJ22_08070 [Haloferacaceae archaeon]